MGVVAAVLAVGGWMVPGARADESIVPTKVLPCPTSCFDVAVPARGLRVPTPTVRVILPAGYGDGDRRFPVVYLLHGAGDGYETWFDNTDVEDFAAAHDIEAIVVMPDSGGKHSEAGWYSNWVDGSRDWEAFHIGVLVPWVDAHFATIPDRAHRAVAGLSMGGFGALSYAGRHPELFGAAASFSGLLDTQELGPVSGVGFSLTHDYFGTPDARVWGAPLRHRDTWAAHNPAALARSGALRGLHGNLWLTSGTGTPRGPAGDDFGNPGGYAVEQFIWQTNQSFKAALAESGTAFHDESYTGGLHDWPHWQYALHAVLPDLVAAVSATN